MDDSLENPTRNQHSPDSQEYPPLNPTLNNPTAKPEIYNPAEKETINFLQWNNLHDVARQIDSCKNIIQARKYVKNISDYHFIASDLFTAGKMPTNIPITKLEDLVEVAHIAAKNVTALIAANAFYNRLVSKDATKPQEFQTVTSKKSAKRRLENNTPYTTQTGNKFAVLSSDEHDPSAASDDDSSQPQDKNPRKKKGKRIRQEKTVPQAEETSSPPASNTTQDTPSKERKPRSPPPIFWANISDPRDALRKLDEHLGHPIKGELKGTDLKILPESPDDYRKIRAHLVTLEAKCHTYSLPEDRHIRVVVRGLGYNFPIEDITAALQVDGIIPIELFQMQGKKDDEGNRPPMPLYQVVVPRTESGKKIYNIDSICNLKVKIEASHKRQGHQQCYRCQRWGHSSKLCTRDPFCVKCAKNHLTQDCTKTREEPATCANCGGPHPASYTGCIKYPGNWKMTPPPEKNFWKERAKKRETTKINSQSQISNHVVEKLGHVLKSPPELTHYSSEDEPFDQPSPTEDSHLELKLNMVRKLALKIKQIPPNHQSYLSALKALSDVVDALYVL